MCGIVGQARTDRAPVSAELLERMCIALEHRGPDSRGVHADDGIGLGIQRLRIIDLDTGDQPIYNEDGTVVVVLNGEIYNFAELRERLIKRGHQFRTHGDTEVIVHLYEDEGPECVNSLHGMFAFALWDARRKQLLLARDRVGKKPLFYAERDGAISFASELRALMQDGEISRELDHAALDCYYAYQYIPAPLSVFKAVRKLPPASRMIWREGRANIERYWRLDYGRKRRESPAELQEHLRELIRAAVKRRMVADVPLGAFLSGGVDSSIVVAAMAQQSAMPVKTFSIGFDHSDYNELPYARQIAKLFDTDHHEFIVDPSAIEMLPKIVQHYGEPFADSSAIPSFYLAELTRQHVTVALNGDGGDESFAGYHRYVGNILDHRIQSSVPPPLRRAAAHVAHRLPEGRRTRGPVSRGLRLMRRLTLDGPEQYARHMTFFDPGARAQLYTHEYRELIGDSGAAGVIADPWSRASGESLVDVMLEVDVETYLPGDLLVKMDIATMAYSLEARSPLLDHELMEFAASVPAQYKLQQSEKKILLRDAVRPWLPSELLDRRKMGFGVPLVSWFRNELRDHVSDVLLDPQTLGRGYFRESYIRRLIDRHNSHAEDCSAKLWALLVGELWHREFVDQLVPAPAVSH